MNWDNACNYQREVSWQGRLDKTLERQKIKLNDNRLKHVGTPEDVIVIQNKTNLEGDIISKVVKEHKIVNCVFPVLKDLPMQKKTTEFGDGYTAISIFSAKGEGSDKGQGNEQKDLQTIEVQVPMDADIAKDDRIIRVMVQEDLNSCSVMVFDVIELLGDFSNNSPLSMKARISLTNDPPDLNKPLYQLIMAMAKRRLAANY